jgi:hypothetical protein
MCNFATIDTRESDVDCRYVYWRCIVILARPSNAAYDGEKTSFTSRLIYRGILINRVSNLDGL